MLALIIGVPLHIYFNYPELIEQFRTMESTNDFLARYEGVGILVYVGLQIIQVLVSIIPGQVVQFAGGYAYGFWLGYLFAIIGIGIGTILSFYLARFLGKDAMHIIFGKERITKFINQLNSKKAFAIILILFIIPGIPKDLIVYAAGVSEFRFKIFLILSMTGRTPALMITVMMGSMLHKGSYFGMIMLGIGAVLAFIFCFFNRQHLTEYTDSIYKRLTK
jgi:uncharacterized membrane protein YdjX (TVP38/TMEM64 family)